MDNPNAKQINDNVCLVELLARLGYHPVRPSGRELLYNSMLRENNSRPTFSVSEKLGVWYDHGLGKGGNIIDFGLCYWNLCLDDTLEKIAAVIGAPIQKRKPRRRHAVKLPNYHIDHIKKLGSSPAITSFLRERGIWQAAQGRMAEIYYYVEDEKKLRKYFSAPGCQNETGSWEVRGKYFSGCLGHKALTIIERSSEKLSVFQSYFDYLSWLTEQPQRPTDTVIITNSISLLPQAISKAKEFEKTDLYFDHHETGRQATIQFQEQLPLAADRSAIYKDFKSYNEKLVAPTIQKPGIFHHAFDED